MVASSLATIVIHFPFRLMSGLAGSFFRELSDTMQLTLIASFLVTWLLLPVLHLAIGYKEKLHPRNSDVGEFAERSVRRVHGLTWLYRKPGDRRWLYSAFGRSWLVCLYPAGLGLFTRFR